MTKHPPLYVRKNGKVHGPFPPKQIAQSLLLGRFRLQDEVSEDKETWRRIQSRQDLVPEVLRGDLSDEQVQERLKAARRWADERRPAHAIPGDSRRSPEPDELLEYRHHRESVYRSFMGGREFSALQVGGIFLLLAGLILAGFYFSPEAEITQPDCDAPAAAGVNWRHCRMAGAQLIKADLRGANLDSAILRGASLPGASLAGANLQYADLSAANLSYADLSGAQMKGCNLQGADLDHADLRGANLQYADFSGARIQDMRIDAAQLDNAIWVDGRTCLRGSLGECRTVRHSP